MFVYFGVSKLQIHLYFHLLSKVSGRSNSLIQDATQHTIKTSTLQRHAIKFKISRTVKLHGNALDAAKEFRAAVEMGHIVNAARATLQRARRRAQRCSVIVDELQKGKSKVNYIECR